MSIQKTLYASPYMVVEQKGYTKHYFNGEERFASRIGGGGLRLIDKPVSMLVYNRDMADVRSEYIPKPSDDLQTSPYIPLFEDGKPNYKIDDGSSVFIDHTNRIDQYLESVTHMLDRAMEHNPYSLEILYDLRIDRGKPTEVYYYHTDHLGSSSWITDDWEDAVQYLQYLPFGELWTDQRFTEWNTRYTFSGKEKDVETGYSYFGARYYDANLSIWLSVDPMAYMSPHQSPYAYCSNNPIRRIDPTGMIDGDFFTENGVYLGTDGKDDGKVHIVTDYRSQEKIKENWRKGKTTNMEDVNVKVSTSYEVLNEAIGVYDRTVDNGGAKEEASTLDNNGNWYRTSGTETGVEIPISKGPVSIHSHPFTEGDNGAHATPTQASSKDISTFTGFGQNIIVGRDGGKYDPSTNWRTNRTPTVSFYGNNNPKGIPNFSMSISNIKNIIKRWVSN